jgi:predicted restriction endonuclease
MKIPYLKEQHGKEILIPEDSRSKPNKDSLKWHRENVFGIFLRSES